MREKDHIQRIREKAETAEGLGPFWRGILLDALASIDAERTNNDRYRLALMMIREGCADPSDFAARTLTKVTIMEGGA